MPWNNRVTEDKKRLPDELIADLLSESSGILNWALDGLKDFYKNGFFIPEAVKSASEEYRESQDTLKEFLTDNLKSAPGSKCLLKDIYDRYEKSTKRPLGKIKFRDALRARKYTVKESGQNKLFVFDVEFIENQESSNF